MLKKVMVLVAAMMLPLLAASAVSAAPAQYPPSAGGVPGGGDVAGGGAGQPTNANGTTLARTGSDTGPLVLVGIALVSVGGIALVTSRRLRPTS
jgi:LPXTG-motif cell wall-anchored protein